jgi:hypothetical protein
MPIRSRVLVSILLLAFATESRAIDRSLKGSEPEAATEATTEDTTAPEAATEAAEPAPLAGAQKERMAAFEHGTLSFTSTGRIKALMMKFDRNLHYVFKSIPPDAAVEVTMVDRIHNNKETTGRLDITPTGALRTKVTELTNACNIGLIDTVTRAKLRKSDEPVVTRSKMEVDGAIKLIEATHTREGDVADDGSMRVKSETTSTDGKVHLTTVTTLAPDGLPWLAETSGTIAKGPISLDVKLKLQRDNTDDPTGATGE